jgi:hypothetical protein
MLMQNKTNDTSFISSKDKQEINSRMIQPLLFVSEFLYDEKVELGDPIINLTPQSYNLQSENRNEVRQELLWIAKIPEITMKDGIPKQIFKKDFEKLKKEKLQKLKFGYSSLETVSPDVGYGGVLHSYKPGNVDSADVGLDVERSVELIKHICEFLIKKDVKNIIQLLGLVGWLLLSKDGKSNFDKEFCKRIHEKKISQEGLSIAQHLMNSLLIFQQGILDNVSKRFDVKDGSSKKIFRWCDELLVYFFIPFLRVEEILIRSCEYFIHNTSVQTYYSLTPERLHLLYQLSIPKFDNNNDKKKELNIMLFEVVDEEMYASLSLGLAISTINNTNRQLSGSSLETYFSKLFPHYNRMLYLFYTQPQLFHRMSRFFPAIVQHLVSNPLFLSDQHCDGVDETCQQLLIFLLYNYLKEKKNREICRVIIYLLTSFYFPTSPVITIWWDCCVVREVKTTG